MRFCAAGFSLPVPHSALMIMMVVAKLLPAPAEMSLALGTEMRLLLNRRLGLAVSGQAFYGPDILTFGSADSLTDLSARVEMNVAPRLTAFGGMRWFEFDLAGGKRTLQEELFVGAGYQF